LFIKKLKTLWHNKAGADSRIGNVAILFFGQAARYALRELLAQTIRETLRSYLRKKIQFPIGKMR